MIDEYSFIFVSLALCIFVVLLNILISMVLVKRIKKETGTKITLIKEDIWELKSLDVIEDARKRKYLSILKRKKEDLDRELERLSND